MGRISRKMVREMWDIHIPDKYQEAWNNWEIRVLVILSFLLQTILILCGSHRKRCKSQVLTFALWSSYLSADWVATTALGVLSSSPSSGNDNSQNEQQELLTLWAPFLLLHLGGPDNFTSFSLEDNALWLRHGLGLVFQVGLAIFIFVRSLPNTKLLVPTLLMFVAGILKYGERTFALYSASIDQIKNSMITDPDPGLDYAKLMEEYASRENAGLPAQIIDDPELEGSPSFDEIIAKDVYGGQNPVETPLQKRKRLLYTADEFFDTFKRLFLDITLTFHDRNYSSATFIWIGSEEAMEIVDMELNFAYEMIYTKATVVHTVSGRMLRILCSLSILSCSVLFFLENKHQYHATDVAITYVLIYGAIALDWFAVLLFVFSERMIIALKDNRSFGWLQDSILTVVLKVHTLFKLRRWCNSMRQYGLIASCLHDRDRNAFLTKAIEFFKLKELLEPCKYTSQAVSPGFKHFIYNELRHKVLITKDRKDCKGYGSFRGQWALEKRGYLGDLGWSVQVDHFDESLLLWHIATDLCYHSDYPSKEKIADATHMCKHLSDYLLYLLVAQPLMLSSTAGIGQIRYGDTYAEAMKFFRRGEQAQSEHGACSQLLQTRTDVLPKRVKGDKCKSVLWDACRLAKQLQKLQGDKWEVMREVWVEMLSFAASQCRANYHAKVLTEGGELLTNVWFLMTHLGIGEQYAVEVDRTVVHLEVEK